MTTHPLPERNAKEGNTSWREKVPKERGHGEVRGTPHALGAKRRVRPSAWLSGWHEHLTGVKAKQRGNTLIYAWGDGGGTSTPRARSGSEEQDPPPRLLGVVRTPNGEVRGTPHPLRTL